MSTFFLCLRAIVLGIIEGITEWLPISSTGHMLLAESFLSIKASVSEAFYSFFLVAIQMGAVLAVLLLYFQRLNPWTKRKTNAERGKTLHLWGCVAIGILPAALLGIPLDDFLEEHLYGAPVIALALLSYGFLFILLERRKKTEEDFRVMRVEDLSFWDAFRIGCFQALSLIPGTSRSGSTILGGMLLGVSRKASAEFSFFLAVPVMAGASLVRLGKLLAAGVGIRAQEWLVLLSGTFFAFLVSLAVIRALTAYVRRHSFEVFGWYRVALGLLVLLFGALSSAA